MQRIIFLLLFSCLTLPSLAQLDSLVEVFQAMPKTEAKVDSGNYWVWYYGRQEAQTANALTRQNLNVAREIEYVDGELKCLLNMGQSYSVPPLLNHDSVLHYHQLCLDKAIAVEHWKYAAGSSSGLGMEYAEMERVDLAIPHYEMAQEYANKAGDKRLWTQATGNMGELYRRNDRLILAEKCFKDALEILREMKNHRGIMFNLNCLFMLNVQRDDFNKCEDILQEIEAEMDTTICKDHLNYLTKKARVAYAKEDYRSSISFSEKALTRGKACPPGFAQPNISYHWMAKSYFQLKDYKNAEKYCMMDLENVEGIYDKADELSARLLLADVYELSRQSEKAIANWRTIHALEKQIHTENIDLAVADGVAKYKLDSVQQAEMAKTAVEVEKRKNQEELAALSQSQFEAEQSKNYLLIGVLLLAALGVLLLVALLRNSNRSKKKIEEQTVLLKAALEEKEVLMREIHHRVKNNLQSITSMLQIQKRRSSHEEVQESLSVSLGRISTLSKLHGILYTQKDLSKVDVHEYVDDVVSKTIAVFDRSANVQLDLKALELDQDRLLYFGFIVNEWVTNALKYANTDSLKITIVAEKEGNQFSVKMQDNGEGYELETVQRGFGITLMEHLSKQLKGEMQYDSSDNITQLKIAS